MAPLAAITLPVMIAGEILDDPNIPITLSHLTTGHCTDMILIHVGTAGGIVFVSDLYNPGNGGSSLSNVFAQELLTAIEAGQPTATIAGGHGSTAPLSELQNFAQPGRRLGSTDEHAASRAAENREAAHRCSSPSQRFTMRRAFDVCMAACCASDRSRAGAGERVHED
jgi:hypothetical protein